MHIATKKDRNVGVLSVINVYIVCRFPKNPHLHPHLQKNTYF